MRKFMLQKLITSTVIGMATSHHYIQLMVPQLIKDTTINNQIMGTSPLFICLMVPLDIILGISHNNRATGTSHLDTQLMVPQF